ncbi:mitogen-activated protein kinase [Trypanosoma equiperdum]|uniref:cyclin-dependent kinase n=2 Tax=Trypanozoon TaxID=39700 RepID=Q381A7_TRYB2|nr:mitogen activated protein kinase, putative [Trypanosoma brucei brucei TREU927]EAN80624.1 mitogen activated protein kinase, putative [Trypanosoma brucei brucei TREU927]SCU69995.1 mitogen-activated protein kinase [Trypanosoma equiperdum]
MDAYETLGMLGEGTYGVVVKARHRATSRIVAIKKYKQAEDDDHVRKTSLREVRVLKQLRHPNVIALLDVFRRDGKLYLVFEYVENTILQLIEEKKYGLSPDEVRRYTFQLLNGVSYCHAHNIIHRDVKPENILVSRDGVLKLCDFGFARQLSCRGNYTEYVATRWYRAPELLVGDVSYGKAVDVWAIGCVFSELSDGQPLFPGDSDLDQLSLIMRACGPVPQQMVSTFEHNALYRRVTFPNVDVEETLQQRFPTAASPWLEFLTSCLRMDPVERPSCTALMSMAYFTENNFRATYELELRELFQHCQPPLVDVAPTSPDHNFSREQQHQQQTLGNDRVDAELTLPRLAAPSLDAETTDKVDSAESKNTTMGVSSEVVGGVGGSVVVDSNSNSFHQLGALWSHYIGSTVGATMALSGELPNIGPRQAHPYPSGLPPGVQVTKPVPRSGTNSVGDKNYNGVQAMKVTGCLRLSAKNISRSPDVQRVKASAAQSGPKVKQAKSEVKPEQKREWKSCSALGKSVKPNYLFPLLPNGTNNSGITSYGPSGVAVGAGPAPQDACSPLVSKGLRPPSSNGIPGAGLHSNGSTTSFSAHKDEKMDLGCGEQNNNGSDHKQRKKHVKRTHDNGELEGPPRKVSDKPSSQHSVAGHRYSFRDGATKR